MRLINVTKKYLLIGFICCTIPSSMSAHYYSFINEAEQLITVQKYKDAIQVYLKVIDKYSHARANDYYNLVNCLIAEDNWDLVPRYIDSCFTHGYKRQDFNYLTLNRILTYTSDSNQWNKRCDSLIHAFEIDKDNSVYKNLSNLVSIDQEISRLGIDKKSMVDSIFYANGKRVFNLINSDSIPKKELFNFNYQNIRSTIPWVLIRHYFGMSNRAKIYARSQKADHDFYATVVNDTTLYTSLIRLINKGRFAPEILRSGLIYNQESEQFGFIGSKNFFIRNETQIIQKISLINPQYSKRQIDLFNFNRKKIGLPTYEEELNVVNFCNSQNNNEEMLNFHMSYKGQIQNLLFSNEKMRFKKTIRNIKVQLRINNRWKTIDIVQKKKSNI